MATVPILYIPPSVGEASSSPADFTVGSNLYVTKSAFIHGNLTVNGSINGGGGGTNVTTTTLDNNTLPASLTSLAVSGTATVGGSSIVTVTTLDNATLPASFTTLNTSGNAVIGGTLSINTTTLTGGNAVAIQLPSSAGTLALTPASGSYVTTVTLDNATLPASFTTLNTAGVMLMTLPGTGNTNFINAFEASQATNTAVAMSFGQSNATNLGGTLNFLFTSSTLTNKVNIGLINGSQLSITGAGAFSTPHVTIDDGTGAGSFITLATTGATNIGGQLNVSGTISTFTTPAGILLGNYQSVPAIWGSLSGAVSSLKLISTGLSSAGSSGTIRATLDDGTGASTFASVTMSGNSSTTGLVSTATGGAFLDSANLNLRFKSTALSSNGWNIFSTGGTGVLTVLNNTSAGGSKISTPNAIFDDGTGLSTYRGVIINPTGTASTATTGMDLLQSTLAAANFIQANVGVSVGTNNCAQLQFVYAGSGLTTNQLNLKLAGGTNQLSILGSGIIGTNNNQIDNGSGLATFGSLTVNGLITTTLSGTGSGPLAELLQPLLANAGTNNIQLGVSLNPNNAAVLSFNYIGGTGSSANTIGIGLRGGTNVSVDGTGKLIIPSNTLVNSTANNITLPTTGGKLDLVSNFVGTWTGGTSPVVFTSVVASTGFAVGTNNITVPIGTYDIYASISATVLATTTGDIELQLPAGWTVNGPIEAYVVNATASLAALTITLITNATNTVASNSFQITSHNVTGGFGYLSMRLTTA